MKPLPPKRPISAFFIYKRLRYEDSKKENPTLGLGDITKKISEEWKNSVSQTKKFEI